MNSRGRPKRYKPLDNFADDTQMPSDLRAEALLHKAMIMRDMNRHPPGQTGRKPRD